MINRQLRQKARWSKRTDELVLYVAQGTRPGLKSELGRWLEDSPRFKDFLGANQDKVRKKLSTTDEEARLDVRAELLVAYLLLADRRFELTFEAYGTGRAGPDFTVAFRTNQRFNLEVTRLRAAAESGETAGRLANVIAGKLRQLPGELPNALLIAPRGLALSEESLAAATRLLKSHGDVKDDAFFARRGLKNARDFYAQFLHLSCIFVLDEATTPPGALASTNREARHALPHEAISGVLAALRPS